jgi:hypothetical protein
MTARDWPAEGRVVARLAGAGKSVSARLVRGAINDCYEKLAASVLEQTVGKAEVMGMSVAEHHAAVADYLRLQAAEARLRLR